MRKCLSLLFSCLLCIAFIATTGEATSIRLEPTLTNISIGDDFALEVFADEVILTDGILAFAFDLDPLSDLSAFTFNGANVNNSYFWDDSALFPDTDVAGSVPFMSPLPSGDGILLATLNFTAIQSGDWTLGIKSDPTEGIVLLPSPPIDIIAGASITVASVPEPASMLLFGTGLAGLAALRRKTKR